MLAEKALLKVYEEYRETRDAIDRINSKIQEMKEHGFSYPSVEYDIAVRVFESGNKYAYV